LDGSQIEVTAHFDKNNESDPSCSWRTGIGEYFGDVTGTVTAAETGGAVVGAQVIVTGGRGMATTTTDGRGRYQLEAEPGLYVIEVLADGYGFGRRVVEVPDAAAKVSAQVVLSRNGPEPPAAPGMPVNFRLEGTTLVWDPPEPGSGGPVTAYHLYRQVSTFEEQDDPHCTPPVTGAWEHSVEPPGPYQAHLPGIAGEAVFAVAYGPGGCSPPTRALTIPTPTTNPPTTNPPDPTLIGPANTPTTPEGPGLPTNLALGVFPLTTLLTWHHRTRQRRQARLRTSG
jgi:hypothetical protein